MTNLNNEQWTTNEDYGTPVALLKVDVMRPLHGGEFIRWSYELMIEITPTKRGLDYSGSRATGYAEAAIISLRPEPKVERTLIEVGGTIETPYGNYEVEWLSNTNKDHLKLIPF